MIERIVIPLDGSAQAERILPKALDFFRCPETELNLLVVVDMEGKVEGSSLPVTCSGHRAKQYLESVAEKYARGGVKLSTDVRFGKAAPKILEHAIESRADLIAMSTHGRAGFDRAIRGSVAEAVLRGADVPVFMARILRGRDMDTGKTPAQARRILVPLDGSAGSEAVLPFVRVLAGRSGATVEVLRVAEWGPPTVVAPHAHVEAEGWTMRAETYVRTVAEQLRAEGILADPVVLHGSPGGTILGRAASGEVHLVAMSTHGYSGVKRLVFGSVAEEVLRSLAVPLLAVREHVLAEAEPQATPAE